MNLNKASGKNKLYEELIADGEIQRVSLSLVDRDLNQPRSLEEVNLAAKDLAPSIEINGMVQMPVYWAKPDGRFLIIVGDCRTQAANLLEWQDLAAVVKSFDDTAQAKKKIAEIRWAENDSKTRKSLTPLDEALFWTNYIEEFYTVDGEPQVKVAAEYLGLNQAKISQFLGINRATNKVKALIKKHKINDYQLAYIMARMEKHKGLVDTFIEKIESVDMKGGIQALANKMLKDAKQADKEYGQKKPLELPPKTATQLNKEREERERKETAEKNFEEEMQKAFSHEKDDSNEDLQQESVEPENSVIVDDDEKPEEQENQENEEPTQGHDSLYEKAVELVKQKNKVSIRSIQHELGVEYNRSERIIEALQEAGVVSKMNADGSCDSLNPCEVKSNQPANTGTVCLKMNKNTIVFSTIANQPATLNENQVQALVEQLLGWIEK